MRLVVGRLGTPWPARGELRCRASISAARVAPAWAWVQVAAWARHRAAAAWARHRAAAAWAAHRAAAAWALHRAVAVAARVRAAARAPSQQEEPARAQPAEPEACPARP